MHKEHIKINCKGYMEAKKVGIIGGNGRYGIFWRTFFEKHGCEVRFSDIDTQWTNEEVVKWADVVFFSVTLMETTKTIRSLMPFFQPEQLLVDIASTKSGTVKAMLESSSDVLGLHPFCAPPRSGTFKGQTIFASFARVNAWRKWADESLALTGATIDIVSPERHDRERTVDQMLEHMCTNLKVAVMCRLGLDPRRLFEVASPVYKLTTVQMARMYAQSAELYGGIPMSNIFAKETLRIFQEEYTRYVKKIETSDMVGYKALFADGQSYLGPENIATAFALSEELIGFMGDLSKERSMRVSLSEDAPGILERIGAVFKEEGINVNTFHSRKCGDLWEFFIGFDQDKSSPSVLKARLRLAHEIGANVV